MFKIESELRLLTFGLFAAFAVTANAGPNPVKVGIAQSSKSADFQRRLIEREAKFFENAGQWDSRGQFLARQPNLDVWFENRGVDFDYYKVSGPLHNRTRQGQRVSMQFVGHEKTAFKGVTVTGSINDYLIGSSKVHRAHGFSEVASNSVFPGINFRGYFQSQHPRYDFIVSPKADPSNIKLRFVGADRVSISKLGVVLNTHLGQRVQGDLHAYQIVNGVQKSVDAKFTMLSKDEVGVKIGKYDHSRQLVVDPLIYGTYFGGDGGFDEVRSVVANNSGGSSSYLTGYTQSTVFPAIYGPYGLNLKGSQNAFLASLQGDAFNIDYAAYIGGSGSDTGLFLKQDPAGNIWMAGTSSSSDFPGNLRANKMLIDGAVSGSGTFTLSYNRVKTNPIPYNATPATVLNALNLIPALTGKIISVTEVDGTLLSQGGRYEVDLAASLPLELVAQSQTLSYGVEQNQYAFVLPFALSNTTVLNPLPTQEFSFGNAFGTQLNGYDVNQGSTSTVDMVFSGTVVRKIAEMTGVTYPGMDDTQKGYMFRMGFTSSGGYVVNSPFSTYISGSFAVNNRGVVLDSTGNAFVCGTVFGDANYDTSVNPVFTTTGSVFYGGRLLRQADIYVQEYSGTSGALVWSGLLGGHSNDYAGGFFYDVDLTPVTTGSAIAIDPSDNVYVTGVSNSYDFPRTRGVYGEDFTDLQNVTVTKISGDGTAILYSTNLNSSQNNIPAGIAVDAHGDAFVTGNGLPGEIFPEDIGQTAGDPDQPTTTVYSTIGVTPDGLAQPTFPTAPALGVDSAWINVLSTDATTLLYGSYFGGQLSTRVDAPYLDSFGDCWTYGWVESYRGYAIFSSTGVPTIYNQNSGLPASMLTPNAFKSYPDNGGPSNTTYAYGLLDYYGNLMTAAPFYVGGSSLRDGWVNKIRVGLPSVQALTLTPATIPGGFGASSVGTITLSTAAPSGGAVVNIAIVSGTGASFSTTSQVSTLVVTIPQGQTTGTFTVYSQVVTANQVATIQADYLGSFQDAALSIVPYLNRFSISPTTVVGGTSVSGTIQLYSAAPAGGLPVVLSTSTPSLISFTSGGITSSTETVTVPAGQNTVTVPINTGGVITNTPAYVSATLAGFSLTQSVELTPASLSTLTFAPNPVPGGDSAVGTITLTGVAPAGGLVVNLTAASSIPSGFTYPSTATVPAGSSTGTFPVSTPYLTSNTNVTLKAVIAPVTGGTFSTASITGTLNIEAISLTSLTISPTTVAAGSTATGTVTIGQVAPAGGVILTLSSSDPTNGSVPATVTIPVGTSTGTFTIQAGYPSAAETITISASLGSAKVSSTLTVNPEVFSLVLNPAEVTGGQSSTGALTIPSAATTSFTVAISVSPANVGVSAPSSVTIPAGSTEVDFPITTTGVTTQQIVTITASLSKSDGVSAQLIVDPVGVAGISFAPNPVHGLHTTQCTVTLLSAAVANATVVLSETNPYLILPTSVTIPAGQTSITFAVTARPVSRPVSTTVKATYNGVASTIVTVLR